MPPIALGGAEGRVRFLVTKTHKCSFKFIMCVKHIIDIDVSFNLMLQLMDELMCSFIIISRNQNAIRYSTT